MDNILAHAIKETIILGHVEREKGRFHVGMTGTPNYISRIGVLMWSILKHNPDMPFSFHILVNQLPEEEKKKLEELIQQMPCLIYVHIIDDNAFQMIKSVKYSSVFFYRFMLPELVGNLSDRVLYVDGDMICRGSIYELMNMDFQGNLACVTTDGYGQKAAERLGTERYFNSGMMLINVDRWKQLHMFERVISFSLEAAKHIDAHGRHMEWHGADYNDQNVLNILMDKEILFVDKKYNFLYVLTLSNPLKKRISHEDFRKGIILHFAGRVKPWHSWVQYLPVVQEYSHWQWESPWKDVAPQEPKSYQDIKQVIRYERLKGHWGSQISWYLKYFRVKYGF